MEKPPSRYYLGLFLFVIVIILGFGAAIMMTIDEKEVLSSPFASFWLSWLSPAAFVFGYLVKLLPQEPYKLKNRLLGGTPLIFFFVGTVAMVFLPDYNPIRLLLNIIGMSSLAGWLFAEASNRFRAKINN